MTTLNAGTAIGAGTLTSASVSLSDPRPTQTSSYTFTGSSVDTSTAILCIQVVWSTTSTGDTAPTGFSGASGSVDAANSSFVNNTATNWSLAKSDGTSSSGQNNIYKYTNSASGYTPSSSPRTFVLTGITNPSTADTAYFLKINTYGNTDCASSPIDNATVQFINTNGSTLNLTIDASLTFSIAGVTSGTTCAGAGTTASGNSTPTTLPFGSVTSAANKYMCQDLSASTNATNGYTIFARYTGEPVNNLAQTISDVSPGTNNDPDTFSPAGTEAYGYTTNDQTLSGSAGTGAGQASRFYNGSTYQWGAMETTNREVGYEPTGISSTTYRITHQVGASLTTDPGSYSTTVVYTCTPIY